MDKKQLLEELIKGLKSIKTELESELAKAVKKPAKDEDTEKDSAMTVRQRILRGHVENGKVSSDAWKEVHDPKNYPDHLKAKMKKEDSMCKEDSAEESSEKTGEESSPEKSEGSEKSPEASAKKPDAKERFKNILAGMKNKAK